MDNSEDARTTRPAKPDAGTPDGNDDDLELIEQLLTLALAAINRKVPEVRLADVLKLLEFKHRMKPQTDVRAVFWEWIERFRREAARTDRTDDNSPGYPQTGTEEETTQ